MASWKRNNTPRGFNVGVICFITFVSHDKQICFILLFCLKSPNFIPTILPHHISLSIIVVNLAKIQYIF